MVGLISTKKLMKQVPRYATGDEVISGADVENQISILDRLIPALKEGSYMLPGTGDVMSAMDSVEAAKAAMKAERLRDQLKLWALSGVAAAGAVPGVSALWDASGPAVKKMINKAIAESQKFSPQLATPGGGTVDTSILQMGKVEMPGTGSGKKGIGTGRGATVRETEISNKRKYVNKKLKEIYDNAPKDKDGLPKLSTNWATSKETKKQIYDSDPNMFPEWKDGIGSWNDLGSGFLAGKIVRGKPTGDQVTSVKLPVSETKAPYKQAEIDFNTAVSKKLNVDSLKPQDQTLKYLNFIRLSESDELLKNSDKFFKKYNFDDLNIPGTKLNENFEKFKILDNKRIALRDDPAIQSLMRKIFPDTEIKFDIAHTFESGQIRKGKVSKSKQGKGGDADEMYIDLSVINRSMQKDLEKDARFLEQLLSTKNLSKTERREVIINLEAINTKLTGMGVQGQTVTKVGDNIQSGFILGNKNVKFSNKIANMAEDRGIKLTDKDYETLLRADNIVKPLAGFKSGGMVQSMKYGGTPIRKFDNGGEATGISSEPLSEEQDTSGVAGLMDEDLNRFLPPHLRFAKNLTGNTVLDFGAEMARYMTPGLGEYLSHEDYKLYSSELAQAFKNKEFLTAAGLSIPTMLAMAGTVIPNHTLVGVPISAAEAVVKKAMKPKLKQLEKPKDIRYKIRDKDGKTVYQTKNKQEAEEHAQRLSGETGEDFIVDEIEFMPKEKVEVMESKPYDIVNDAGQVIATRRNKNQAEKYLKRHPNENLRMIERNLPDVPRLDPKRLVDVGDNRQFYSKSQQAFDKGFDLSTGDATLTAKQWHDYFRSEGVREQELVDSYVRTLLDRKGAFNKETQTFTSNAPSKASEIKELIDNSPAMHVQSVQFSDAAGNLKYGTSGRLDGHAAGSKRENVIWIDSADIRGDPGLLSDLAKREGTQHDKFYKVKTDKAKFDAGRAKLEGEPYIIGWSLVDTRPGKDAFGKTIKVDLASEIQSDLLQKAATRKAKLKQKISQLGTGSPQEVQKLLQEIDYIFRPMGRTATEIQELVQRLTANQQKFTNASKLELDDVTPALLKDLDNAKIDRDNILNEMFAIVDGISINDLYPNVPLKNSKDWVDTIVKNDVYLAAKNRFTILDDGTIKINKNAPSHYAPNSPATVKTHWGSTGEEAGQMYDIIYNNAADSLKRIAKETGSDVQLGKVKQGGSLVEVPMIELVPEMLYSQVQYFKDGGLVQKQYTPLVSIFKPLGVSYGY